MSKEEIIIGIDLGTTTSEACIYISKSKLKMIRNEDGDDIIASVVGFDDVDKAIVIGEDASETRNPIEEIKRKMGENIKKTLGDKKVTPEEVSAEILKYIKKYSEESLGEKISRAVITVPATFNINQREATQKAGEMAGFKVERIITEPTAAALAYCMENEKEEEFVKVMVYDLGGGTFDVSIGEFNNGVLEILGGDGDDQLGGGDFDRLLCDYICDDFQKQHGIDLRDDKATKRTILKKAKKAKESLSTRKKILIKAPFISAKDGKPLSLDLELTRESLEGLISEMLEETRKAMQKALKKAKLKADDIDLVLLVGGSSRIPLVREIVKNEMGQKPKYDIDPDRAVSMGAALQSAIISGESDAVILDRVIHSFGISAVVNISGQDVSGYYSEIIPENSPMQKEFSEQYYNVLDNQEEVNIEVYQSDNSESIFASDQKPIKQYKLKGLPPAPAGKESITVKFLYNLDGLLDVTAIIDSTGKKAKFTAEAIGANEGKLPESTDSSNWEESAIAKDFTPTIQIAEKRVNELEGRIDLEEKLNDLKKAVIDEDKILAKTLDDEINDLIFDLDD
jgi:molecular chaperone DnaK